MLLAQLNLEATLTLDLLSVEVGILYFTQLTKQLDQP